MGFVNIVSNAINKRWYPVKMKKRQGKAISHRDAAFFYP